MKNKTTVIFALILIFALWAMPAAAQETAGISEAALSNFSEGEVFTTASGRYTCQYKSGEITIVSYNLNESNLLVVSAIENSDTGNLYPITAIGDKAFADKTIKNLVLPNNLRSISDTAFSGCTALLRIVAQRDVYSIEDYWQIFDDADNNCTLYPTEAEFRYFDVKGWSCEYIYCMTDDGVLSGYDGYFEPDKALTRAQLCTVLANMSGDNLSRYNTASAFADVKQNAWFNSYINWAYDKGIAVMSADKKYRPNDPVTRQELCTMIGRYAESVDKYTLPDQREAISFTDHQAIAGWARDYVYDLYEANVVGGYADNSFRPQNNATRGEAARIITVYLYPDWIV